MNDESQTVINVTGLDQLLKALKQAKPPVVRVGIVGDKNGPHAAKDGQHPRNLPTVAEVGAVHEYGSPARGIPQRSFLRVPLTDMLGKEMEASGAISDDATKDVIKAGSLIPYLKKIAILAERIVLGAFDSGGYGKWPAWKDPNYTNNANQLLVDTQQLRNSITSTVIENE